MNDERKIVFMFITNELGLSKFTVSDSPDGGTNWGRNWRIRRLYVTDDGVRNARSWYANVHYSKGGDIRVYADWIGEKVLHLADPQVGASLRAFLYKSWDKHLVEVGSGVSS